MNAYYQPNTVMNYYICPTCNGHRDYYSDCQTFEFDNRDNREVWKISCPPRVIQGTIKWSHVPSYEPPITNPQQQQQQNLGMVVQTSNKSYSTSQIEQVQTQLIPRSLTPLPQQKQSYRQIEQRKEEIKEGEYQEDTYQIRVNSLNKGQLVWITIEPRETGEAIAQKIYTIAGFRTRKVRSICTGSGRQVVLGKKTFVFSTWDHIHGEIWKIEWEPTKRNMFEKVLDKILSF